MQTDAAAADGHLQSTSGSVGGMVGRARRPLDDTLGAPGSSRMKDSHQQIQHVQISTASQLFAGGVAGAVSKTCTAPLARLTILFQVQGMHSNCAQLSQPRIMHEVSRIWREEGVRAFWKGNGVTIVHRLPYSSINFFAYDQYKLYLKMMLGNDGKQESLGVNMGTRLVAGGGAGITAASLTYPLDLVRTRLAAQLGMEMAHVLVPANSLPLESFGHSGDHQQLKRGAVGGSPQIFSYPGRLIVSLEELMTSNMYYRGITHALATICRDEGYRGLYKGMGATLLGVGPNIAINFCVYETLKSTWLSQRPESSPVLVSLFCGSLAGICSSTATFPIDLVRRRMQLEGVGGRERVYKSGLGGTMKQIFTQEGWLGLYRGIVPEYYKVIPSVGIVFMTYELMKRILQPKPWDGS